MVRTCIFVSGFSESEVREGLPDLLDEFAHRPWIVHPEAVWEPATARLAVTVHYEGSDPESSAAGALDEVRDCIIACLSFASDGIHFELGPSVVTSVA